MNSRYAALCAAGLALCAVVLGFTAMAYAQEPIAKISAFTGEAVIQSEANIVKVTQVGQPLKEGDRVQTQEGEVEVTFSDGAVLKIRPFTSALVQERDEESGFWMFKTSKPVRRLTVLVGKMWFKSGASKRENYLQTPTAVCGLRGSTGEVGNDNVRNLLNIIEGTGVQLGLWTTGPFTDPGRSAATVNPSYTALQTAVTQLAAATTPEQIAAAQQAVLQAALAAAQLIAANNPDPNAQAAANALINAVNAILAPGPLTEPLPTATSPTTTTPTTTTTTTTTTSTTTTSTTSTTSCSGY